MDWSSLRSDTPLSVPERLSVDLERLILEGRLQSGERLPAERELAQQLGVSRVSVREALRELENRGLVDRKPGRGTIVLQPGASVDHHDDVFRAIGRMDTELKHIMELRAIVEPPIAAITARQATSRDRTQLRELIEAMEQAENQYRYAELDRAFHQAIAQYTHNPLLASITEEIATRIAPSRAERYQTHERREASSASHRRIYEAISDADPVRAEAEARAHILDITDHIIHSHHQE